MKLALSQLVHRYAGLRITDRERQSQLLASVAAHGQTTPVVVVRSEEVADHYVLIDGYLRVAALASLHQDEVDAVEWQVDEARALVLSHRLDGARKRSALEEGWLLRALEREHGMRVGEIAMLLGRSPSWVSRRLGLVEVLPASVQEAVRLGRMSAQAAQKYLVPLARANAAQCERLVSHLGNERVSVRQMRELYVGWRGGDATTRQRIVREPILYLRAREAVADEESDTHAESEEAPLLRELGILFGVSVRAQRALDDEVLADASSAHLRRVEKRWEQTERAMSSLGARIKEEVDARLGNANGSASPEPRGARGQGHRASAQGVAKRGPSCAS
jgi:ParB family chromosome partitioning protein